MLLLLQICAFTISHPHDFNHVCLSDCCVSTQFKPSQIWCCNAQVAFLAAMVGPKVAAASAQRALEVLAEEDPAVAAEAAALQQGAAQNGQGPSGRSAAPGLHMHLTCTCIHLPPCTYWATECYLLFQQSLSKARCLGQEGRCATLVIWHDSTGECHEQHKPCGQHCNPMRDKTTSVVSKQKRVLIFVVYEKRAVMQKILLILPAFM